MRWTIPLLLFTACSYPVTEVVENAPTQSVPERSSAPDAGVDAADASDAQEPDGCATCPNVPPED